MLASKIFFIPHPRGLSCTIATKTKGVIGKSGHSDDNFGSVLYRCHTPCPESVVVKETQKGQIATASPPIRAGDQPQNREGARHRSAADAARPRRRGDRMT